MLVGGGNLSGTGRLSISRVLRPKLSTPPQQSQKQMENIGELIRRIQSGDLESYDQGSRAISLLSIQSCLCSAKR